MKKGIRLTTILRKIDMAHMIHPIDPVREDGYVNRANGNSIDSHQTGWEYGNRPIRDKNRQILGDFYEYMTAGFYGGVIRKNIDVASSFVEPDVLNEETKEGFESKACNCAESLKLYDHQLERYQRLQFHVPDYSFYFAAYLHSFRGLKNFEQEDIFRELCDKTLASIVLPLSLVMLMHGTRDKDFVYRYDGERWYTTTAVRSHVLNRFFGDLKPGSEKEVVKDFGGNSDDYVFQRLMSPIRFFIKGNRINSFPVLFIKDREPEKWRKWFLENYSVQEEIPFGEEKEIPF